MLRVLLAARQTLDASGRHIRIINPSAPTARLLQLAGLDTILLAPPHRESQQGLADEVPCIRRAGLHTEIAG